MTRVTIAIAATIVALHAGPARPGEVSVDGRLFTIPAGFTIERVAGPPMVDRPIVADLDEKGRLYVADSSGSNAKVETQLKDRTHRIVRLEDTDGDGVYDRRTVFADRMMFPEGACWRDGSLYVSAPPSIWRLTDRDGDGIAEDRVEWYDGKTLTGCANDLHGPYNGPRRSDLLVQGGLRPPGPRPPEPPPALVPRRPHLPGEGRRDRDRAGDDGGDG